VRALAHRPALVLADEPTGNLDHGIGMRVLALLREQLSASKGSGVLVTHSLEAARTADRILVLADGRLHPWQGETG
jgi:putative ABC transport system ATP-binding protein